MPQGRSTSREQLRNGVRVLTTYALTYSSWKPVRHAGAQPAFSLFSLFDVWFQLSISESRYLETCNWSTKMRACMLYVDEHIGSESEMQRKTGGRDSGRGRGKDTRIKEALPLRERVVQPTLPVSDRFGPFLSRERPDLALSMRELFRQLVICEWRGLKSGRLALKRNGSRFGKQRKANKKAKKPDAK